MSEQPMTIAYITQTYPALTQTFVYRETLALEEKGFNIITCAIWKPDQECLSQESRHLVDRSFYVFPISWFRFVKAHLRWLFRHPIKYFGTLAFALTRKGESVRNRLRTLFHFCEAVYLAPEIQKDRAVHVHAHFTINAATVALVLSRLADISFSFTAHNIFFTDRILLREKVQGANFIVAISRFSKELLNQLVPGEEHKIHVVHCGLSPKDFLPLEKPENEVPLLLFVAQLTERKGASVLVEACSILSERGVPFRCTLVGGGAEQEVLSLRRLVERHRLNDAVELVGAIPQERLKQYLGQADIFILPCVTASNGDMDGIPVSLMEAMAMEIPTVSTYVSGIPELIEHEKSGLLVPEKDPEALADAIQRLLGDEALRISLGKNGRRRIEAEFNIHKNVAQLANLFESYIQIQGETQRLDVHHPGTQLLRE